MLDTDRNSIALPDTATDPDASVRDAFDAARRMLGQLEINRLASIDHAQRLIREDACVVLDWLEALIGVEVGE